MRRTLLFLTAIVGCLGCQEAGEPTKRSTEDHHALPAKAADRMLAALVEHGGQAWSFKLVGPNEAVAKIKPEFVTFLDSVKFGDDPPLTWKLPEGWVEGKKDGRFANLEIGKDGLEVSVFELNKGGADPLANVNRWRGQLGLPKTVPDYLDEDTKSITIGGEKATLVELVGKAMPGIGAQKPMLQPPPKQAQPKPGAGKKEWNYTYDVPNGWVKIPVKKPFVDVQFKLDDPTAFATISVYEGDGGGEAKNIRRWREDSMKLPPMTEDEFARDVRQIDTASGKAVVVDFANPKLPGNNRMLGAIVRGREATAFLKLMGPDDVVGRQKDRFEAFTKSFKVD